MKSNGTPDLHKIFKPRASQAEIDESYDRARRAVGQRWPGRLKPNPNEAQRDPTRGNQNQ